MKKSILITGASSGIGLASTILFAQNDYQVFATYRNHKDGEKLGKFKNVHPIKMDVTDTLKIVCHRRFYFQRNSLLYGI